MKQKFTQNHLVRFIYKETSAAETIAISNAIDTNYDMREEYNNLMHSYKQLPKATFQPKLSTIENILKYNEKTSVQPHL